MTALAVVGFVASAAADPVNLAPYSSIGPNVVDFEDLVGVPRPPLFAIFDGILESRDVRFAERFVGQTLTIVPSGGEPLGGPLDELSGVPNDPLRLQPGDPNKNLAVLRRGDPLNNSLFPCGDLTCRLFAGLGEGAFALIFPAPVSAFGFIARGGDPGGNPDGDIVVQFFRADGTRIAEIHLFAEDFPAVSSFGFQREGGIKDIAGVSIHTSDPAGLDYDDFRYGDLDFGIFCNPLLLDSSASATCTIETQEALDDPVELSCESLPDGAACEFSPPEVIVAGPGSIDVQLSMAVDDRVPESFEFQVAGTSGTLRAEFDMSFEEEKEIPPVPEAPPKETDITFTAKDVSVGCQFRSSGPIAFEIEVTRVVAPAAALNADGTLTNAFDLVVAGVLSPIATFQLMAFDVDRNTQPPSGSFPEINRVFFNDEEIGTLDGENNLWQLNEFEVPISKVRFPEQATLGSKPTGAKNEIRVEIDTDNGADTWCTTVNWSALSIKTMSPVILVHGNNSNSGFWDRQGFTAALAAARIPLDGCGHTNRCRHAIDLPTALVSTNAATLGTTIPAIVESFGTDSYHIVAHSKGGLDSREYLALYEPSDIMLLSLTTLSTPHNGSILADLAMLNDIGARTADRVRFSGLPAFSELVADIVGIDDGTENLSTGFTASFNARNVGRLPTADYNQVGADADRDNSGTVNTEAEIAALRVESNDLPGPTFAAAGLVNRFAYQILRNNRAIRGTPTSGRNFLGQPITIFTIRAVPAPAGVTIQNDVLVTIPSARGVGSMPSTNFTPFIGTDGRNHADVADDGVAATVIRWLLEAETSRGDLQ